ncbi:hypothetical protein GCM10010992_16660 [Cloacibacterium rupense]|uniref:Uncharacterized protein n=1 Tax=Cloacibacterium rupense TaxID=517423 RepID=A0ABQ2NL68_9FLAO|nr:hypothetical protein [Cloacibacterium rupense]GGP04394.1 hypothetical protein GCM10010992_16660 [Cloacibacterium rupense]
MILEKERGFFDNVYTAESFANLKQLMGLWMKDNLKEKLLELYNLKGDESDVIKIGNSKALIDALNRLDNQCEKIDIPTEVKNVYLEKMLEEEKAIFEILNITNKFILEKNNSSTLLKTETVYSAKNDLLDIFSFSKFANYCNENKYEGLIDNIKNYLKEKNLNNTNPLKLRIVYKNEDKKFYLRAHTSTIGYQDFGINFSVFVAFMAINEYVTKTKDEFFVEKFVIDDSKLYVSFGKKNTTKLNENLSLRFALTLENDEIKRNAVSFNGIFTLVYKKGDEESEIIIRPKGMKSNEESFPTDLLTYRHQGKVETVIEKVKNLPILIEKYISQIEKEAEDISNKKNPDSIRELIVKKIRDGRKAEFKQYKAIVQEELNRIRVDNMFKLFELLGSIEKLFEEEDVISIDYWRSKLYEALIEKK